MQRVSNIHEIVARIGLLGMPSQAHHELPQGKDQRLVQIQHLVLVKLGWSHPLGRLPFFPLKLTRQILQAKRRSTV